MVSVALCAAKLLGCLQAILSSGQQTSWQSAQAEGTGQKIGEFRGWGFRGVMEPESTGLTAVAMSLQEGPLRVT